MLGQRGFVSRDRGRRLWLWNVWKVAEANGFDRAEITFDQPLSRFLPTGALPSSPEPNVQPILDDLSTAKTNILLNSAPTDTLAHAAIDAAVTKLNALPSEDVTSALALLASAKDNIDLLSPAGDTAAIADINEAIDIIDSY